MSMDIHTPEDELMGTASGGRFRWARGWTPDRIDALVRRLEADPNLHLPADGSDVPGWHFLERYRQDWLPPLTDADFLEAMQRYDWASRMPR